MRRVDTRDGAAWLSRLIKRLCPAHRPAFALIKAISITSAAQRYIASLSRSVDMQCGTPGLSIMPSPPSRVFGCLAQRYTAESATAGLFRSFDYALRIENTSMSLLQ